MTPNEATAQPAIQLWLIITQCTDVTIAVSELIGVKQ